MYMYIYVYMYIWVLLSRKELPRVAHHLGTAHHNYIHHIYIHHIHIHHIYSNDPALRERAESRGSDLLTHAGARSSTRHSLNPWGAPRAVYVEE